MINNQIESQIKAFCTASELTLEQSKEIIAEAERLISESKSTKNLLLLTEAQKLLNQLKGI